MLKQTVTYQDFDNKTITEDLHFHLSKTRLAENFADIKEALLPVATMLSGSERELTDREKQQVLNLVKYIMELAYGIRVDSKKFRQGPEVWADFYQSAAYDAYLWSLFTNAGKAEEFINGVLPKDILDEASAQSQLPQGEETVKSVETVAAPELNVVQKAQSGVPLTDEERAQLLKRLQNQAD
jgi:hypothetical protein